jgi:hypothetical protein
MNTSIPSRIGSKISILGMEFAWAGNKIAQLRVVGTLSTMRG